MVNILITGVAGFIGSNYVHQVLVKNRGTQIIGLDKLTYAGNIENLTSIINEDDFIFIKGDICDRKLLEKIFHKYEINQIINFAAESHVDRSIHDPQVFLKTNILGTQTLLEVAKTHWSIDTSWKTGCKFLQISTDEVYGSLGAEGKFNENTPLDPHSPYSASKAAADLIVQAYHDTYGIPMNITRCSNNFGPYQFPEKLIPLIIHNALHHKKLPIYGDGRQIRDWIYVLDHCDAIDIVLRNGISGNIYNIGGNNELENIQLVKEIISILNELTEDSSICNNLIEHVTDRPGHDRRYAIDSSKIESDLKWQRRFIFSDVLRTTIQWYMDNPVWIDNVITGEYQKFYEQNYGNR